MSTKSKGDRAELKLVHQLEDCGFEVTKAYCSFGPVDRLAKQDPNIDPTPQAEFNDRTKRQWVTRLPGQHSKLYGYQAKGYSVATFKSNWARDVRKLTQYVAENDLPCIVILAIRVDGNRYRRAEWKYWLIERTSHGT